MGPDLGLKERSKTAVELVSSGKEHGTVTGCRENNKCVDSFDGKSQSKEVNKPDSIADIDVDIIECRTPDEEVFGGDSTENSSSFGDSGSGMDDGSGICDAEVQSQEYCEVSGSGFDGFEELSGIRKRKLTDHWRMFTQPLRWRCKWLELHLTELKRQEMKYERQLAEYNEQRQFETSDLELQGVSPGPQHFPCQIDEEKVMKRRKRKQVEQSADIATYMSKRSLFSYYGSTRLNLVGPSMTGDCGNLDNTKTNGPEPVEFEDNSAEPTFRSIEMLQSKVHVLKARIDKVLSENHIQSSPASTLDFLVVPSDTPAGSQVRPENGDKMSLRSLHDSQPVGAVSSHGDGKCLPDIIESLRQQIASSLETTEEEILIDNEAAREALRDIEQLLLPAGKTPSKVEITKAVQYVTPQPCELLTVTASELSGQPNPESPSAMESEDLLKTV